MNKTSHGKTSDSPLEQGRTDNDYNVFRDSKLRFAGYANEVGESFRYQFPKFVAPSYVVSFGYCFADAIYSGYTTYNCEKIEHKRNQSRNEPIKDASTNSSHLLDSQTHEGKLLHDTVRATIDTLLWQSLASVMIPGATINLIVKASRYLMARRLMTTAATKTAATTSTNTALIQKWFPTAAGLISIPFIVEPIDLAVHHLLDNTTRHWWRPHFDE